MNMAPPAPEPKEKFDNPHDLERVRAEWQPVMGRDHLIWVLWYAFWKVVLKSFSLSTIFAIVASMHLETALESAIEKGVDVGWFPWCFAATAWLNLVARPQFKRLAEGFAKMLENKGPR